ATPLQRARPRTLSPQDAGRRGLNAPRWPLPASTPRDRVAGRIEPRLARILARAPTETLIRLRSEILRRRPAPGRRVGAFPRLLWSGYRPDGHPLRWKSPRRKLIFDSLLVRIRGMS